MTDSFLHRKHVNHCKYVIGIEIQKEMFCMCSTLYRRNVFLESSVEERLSSMSLTYYRLYIILRLLESKKKMFRPHGLFKVPVAQSPRTTFAALMTFYRWKWYKHTTFKAVLRMLSVKKRGFGSAIRAKTSSETVFFDFAPRFLF